MAARKKAAKKPCRRRQAAVKAAAKPAPKGEAKADKPSFDKILIANRGEIACRVIRTCKRLGIKTVAVYSEADADALHVRLADEAVLIGPPPSAQSYLQIDKIVAACRKTGAEAVHPGYGFLSEKQEFQKALAKAEDRLHRSRCAGHRRDGRQDQIQEARAQGRGQHRAGLLHAIKNAEEAVKIAQKVGYPVMIKASAGGGGKGMRIAYNDDEAREGFGSATNEAKASFGDDRVFIEKFVDEPRHIEIQLIADGHGNCVYLWERDARSSAGTRRSSRRRPPRSSTPDAQGDGRAGGGARQGGRLFLRRHGRVHRRQGPQFLLPRDEHPAAGRASGTELTTGLDLVELMLRVAAGEKLPLEQKDVKLDGWAIEAGSMPRTRTAASCPRPAG